MASSNQRSNTRYVKGGTAEQFSNRLGWWEREIIPFRDDDIFVTITGKYVNRPDLIAKRYLGDVEYEWLVLQFNTILNPAEELIEGAQIRLPLITRIT